MRINNDLGFYVQDSVKNFRAACAIVMAVTLTFSGCQNKGAEMSAVQVEPENPSASSYLEAASPVPSSETKENIIVDKEETAKMFNITLQPIPDSYRSPSQRPGTLVKLSYSTKDYAYSSGDTVKKDAVIYLPFGYDEDSDIRYDILYLQHGAYGSETTWLGDDDTPTEMKLIMDNMIAYGDIAPLIIVMPYIDPGTDWYDSTCPAFFQELITDLMPAVESKYKTYAVTGDHDGFLASREHRGFAGFSMGGATTWFAFLNWLDYFRYFIPMSGDCWQLGTLAGGKYPEETAEILAKAGEKAGQDFCIFAATGGKDIACGNLSKQIEAMKRHPEVFEFTETGFDDGNLMYYVVESNSHDYPYTYEYLYNGLRCLFAQL